jgi:hypothetical protein
MIKGVVLSVVGVILLGGLVYWLTPHAAAPTTRSFALAISHKVLAGPHIFTVSEGDTVIFNITTDEREDFHLHGYDRLIGITPGTATSLTVVASMSGRFTFELEQSKTELGELEVYPH